MPHHDCPCLNLSFGQIVALFMFGVQVLVSFCRQWPVGILTAFAVSFWPTGVPDDVGSHVPHRCWLKGPEGLSQVRC
jgi:hypothetical protein